MYDTTTLLELSVGSTHTVEVLVRVRSKDLDWWNQDLNYHLSQMFRLIGRNILPVECYDVIRPPIPSYDNDDDNGGTSIGIGTGTGGNDNGVIVGERNIATTNRRNKGMIDGSRRKRNNKSSKRRKYEGKTVAPKKVPKRKLPPKSSSNNDQRRKYIPGSGLKFLFGDTIQVTYKMEDIPLSHVTLFSMRIAEISRDDNWKQDDAITVATKMLSSNNESSVKLIKLPKIPKRVCVWCYPLDPFAPLKVIAGDGGGFPRPEMNPISS